MRKIALGFAVGVFSFFIGLYWSGAAALNDGAAPKSLDQQVYACSVEELNANHDLYDGKFVRVKFLFSPMDGVSIGNIESREIFRAVCVDEPASCQRLYPKSRSAYDFDPNNVEVEAIGRFTARAADPHPRQRGDKVALLEISQIISVGAWPANPLTDPGRGSGGGSGGKK